MNCLGQRPRAALRGVLDKPVAEIVPNTQPQLIFINHLRPQSFRSRIPASQAEKPLQRSNFRRYGFLVSNISPRPNPENAASYEPDGVTTRRHRRRGERAPAATGVAAGRRESALRIARLTEHKYRSTHQWMTSASLASAVLNGRVITKRVPSPSTDSHAIEPPIACTQSAAMASPRPDPLTPSFASK